MERGGRVTGSKEAGVLEGLRFFFLRGIGGGTFSVDVASLSLTEVSLSAAWAACETVATRVGTVSA